MIDKRATNLFMNPTCVKKLKLIQEQNKKMKVFFNAHSEEIINFIVNDVKFKYGNIRFQKDFTMSNLSRIDVVVENTFLDFYRIEL